MVDICITSIMLCLNLVFFLVTEAPLRFRVVTVAKVKNCGAPSYENKPLRKREKTDPYK